MLMWVVPFTAQLLGLTLAAPGPAYVCGVSIILQNVK